jgi:hypothetical protein
VHPIVEELDIASWDFPTAAFLFRDLKDNAMLVCVGREGSLPGCGKILGVGGGGYERGEGAELKDAFSHQRIFLRGILSRRGFGNGCSARGWYQMNFSSAIDWLGTFHCFFYLHRSESRARAAALRAFQL